MDHTFLVPARKKMCLRVMAGETVQNDVPPLAPPRLNQASTASEGVVDHTFLMPARKRTCLRVMAEETVQNEVPPLGPPPNQAIPPANAVDDFYYLSYSSSDEEDEVEGVNSDEDTLFGESIELPEDEMASVGSNEDNLDEDNIELRVDGVETDSTMVEPTPSQENDKDEIESIGSMVRIYYTFIACILFVIVSLTSK